VKDKVVYASPLNSGEREALADVCVIKLGIEMPAIVDNFDDATDTVYNGWPDRLYVIDREGRVAYKSKPGPFGFKPAEMERALITTIDAPQ
jgi:type I thyroxine 5'-deiodinase